MRTLMGLIAGVVFAAGFYWFFEYSLQVPSNQLIPISVILGAMVGFTLAVTSRKK